ncbi:MAG: hypothetical protein CMA72_06710 [Euryarchaeota archaeon]|jgi:hypothetical protein|nr:hypothetical protein [Euryarchaeota archaeon]
MVRSIEITKATVRDRLVVDSEVWMEHPDDHDFQPRASIEGKRLMISNAGQSIDSASIELDDDQYAAAERDRLIELRVKFGVQGMHGVLVHKTPNPRAGPKAKKLAESRWKTVLPLKF